MPSISPCVEWTWVDCADVDTESLRRTLAYGLQGLFDGFGGIAGASLVPLLMAWAGGSTPAQTATLIGLAGAMGAAALLAVALLNAHREGSRRQCPDVGGSGDGHGDR